MGNRRSPQADQEKLSAEATLESVLKFGGFDERIAAIKQNKQLANKVWKQRLLHDISIPDRIKHFLSYCITGHYEYSSR